MVNILIGLLGHRAVDIVVLASVVVLVPAPILSQLMAAQGVLVLMKNFKIVNMRSRAQVCLSTAYVTYIYKLKEIYWSLYSPLTSSLSPLSYSCPFFYFPLSMLFSLFTPLLSFSFPSSLFPLFPLLPSPSLSFSLLASSLPRFSFPSLSLFVSLYPFVILSLPPFRSSIPFFYSLSLYFLSFYPYTRSSTSSFLFFAVSYYSFESKDFHPKRHRLI